MRRGHISYMLSEPSYPMRRSRWTLNQWLERAWDDGLTRPTESFFATGEQFHLPFCPRPSAQQLSGKAFKALIYMKGWLLKDLAEHWRMRPETLSRIIRTETRCPMFDEAVLGLPLRCDGVLLTRHPEVRSKLQSAVLD